jgi:hypothetical protein
MIGTRALITLCNAYIPHRLVSKLSAWVRYGWSYPAYFESEWLYIQWQGRWFFIIKAWNALVLIKGLKTPYIPSVPVEMHTSWTGAYRCPASNPRLCILRYQIAVSCIAMHEEYTFTTSDRQRLHSSHQTENYADSRIRKFTQAAWLPNLIYMFGQRCMVFN